MPEAAENVLHFSKGMQIDGGPFFSEQGFYRDGLNAQHQDDGSIANRPGIELLDQTKILSSSVDGKTDATYHYHPAMFKAEIVKNDGTTFYPIFLQWGNKVRIYDAALESLNITSPTQTLTLDNYSAEAWYYKPTLDQTENIVVSTNARGPIYKFVYDSDAGTFSAYKVSLLELNELLLKEDIRAVDANPTAGKFFSKEIALKTGQSSYLVTEGVGFQVPGFALNCYLVDDNGVVSYLPSTSDTAGLFYSYSESLDTDSYIYTGYLTFSPAISGYRVRIYFGALQLVDYNAQFQRETITISSASKDYDTGDNSFAPRKVAGHGGRLWFGGADGPLDGTADATYDALGIKSNKLWISPLYAKNLGKAGNTPVLCRTVRSPLDADDNTPSPIDGGTITLDNASRIQDIVPFGSSIYIPCRNGIWAITGPEEYFSLDQAVIKRIVDTTISSRDPSSAFEQGLFVAADNELFQINPQEGIKGLVENRVFTTWSQIPPSVKRVAYTRYDRYNKRHYYFYNDESDTQITANKYNNPGLATKWFVYDEKLQSWQTPASIGNGVWAISDMTNVSADSYFASSDYRYKHKEVNLVLLARHNTDAASNTTELQFGILEGPKYCSDYYGTSYAAPFESYFITNNYFGADVGLSTKKQVARAVFFLKRTEEGDADVDGYYQYPGACYMLKRWRWADSEEAGPYYGYALNSAQDTWVADSQQIYWPHKLGSSSVGGTKSPFEVFAFKTKVRGSGQVIAFRFGNSYGDTSLTGAVQEQEKPWHLQGFQVDLKAYKV